MVYSQGEELTHAGLCADSHARIIDAGLSIKRTGGLFCLGAAEPARQLATGVSRPDRAVSLATPEKAGSDPLVSEATHPQWPGFPSAELAVPWKETVRTIVSPQQLLACTGLIVSDAMIALSGRSPE